MAFVRTISAVLFCACAFSVQASDTNGVMTIRNLLESPQSVPPVVTVEGTVVVHPDTWIFYLRDSSGAAPAINLARGTEIANGDIVRLSGTLTNVDAGLPLLRAARIEILGHSPVSEIPTVEPSRILRGEFDYQLVTVEGVLTDVFPDEADRSWTWGLVEQSGVKVPITIHTTDEERRHLSGLVDATVSITAIAAPDIERRNVMSCSLSTRSLGSLRILNPPPDDPFTCETFAHTPLEQTEHVRKFAHRRRTSGRVVSAWGGRNLFVRLGNGRTVRVRTNGEFALPEAGTPVTAVGFLRKNAFYPRLDNALIHIDGESGGTDDPVRDFDPRQMLSQSGSREINSRLNGEVLRIVGMVRNLVRPETSEAQFDMDCGGCVIPVEIGGFIPPAIGSTVEVTGACVMETEIEDAATLFSRLKGFSLAPRRQTDIRVLKGPPWWTPARFFMAIGILLVVIVAIIIWNIALTRVSDRKSRELLAEKSARLESQLRVDERTRLAIELHDSLAQNLTGVSLQLDAAEMAAATDTREAAVHMDNARHALRSCREELRYCLSDLRSQSFEHADMSEAVADTVRPHIGKARLSVRFNVPRANLSDSSAHAVLCIVRELAVNAVRHGHATEIRIAGETDAGAIRFSVRDNGCGFNPEAHPGPGEGHFGLLGVRERVKAFKGEFAINSTPGVGTKATVKLVP